MIHALPRKHTEGDWGRYLRNMSTEDLSSGYWQIIGKLERGAYAVPARMKYRAQLIEAELGRRGEKP